ncbi:MAG: hypothetical protein Faunusvirus13_15 [Faunusvirus sp.]|jgi:hypothetical protein|uniref:Uncharacterized protein n=1 Tax=Faunusvirus sp. TaxID=2487766 RepID=A0A3G4ZWX9_9VIRU|nr:MAG: hypothetical protein Faunusvirus13_15 [Faunusvirus sp.]
MLSKIIGAFVAKFDSKIHSVYDDERTAWRSLAKSTLDQINIEISSLDDDVKTLYSKIHSKLSDVYKDDYILKSKYDDILSTVQSGELSTYEVINIWDDYYKLFFNGATSRYCEFDDMDSCVRTSICFQKLFIPIFFKWSNKNTTDFDEDINDFNKLTSKYLSFQKKSPDYSKYRFELNHNIVNEQNKILKDMLEYVVQYTNKYEQYSYYDKIVKNYLVKYETTAC